MNSNGQRSTKALVSKCFCYEKLSSPVPLIRHKELVSSDYQQFEENNSQWTSHDNNHWPHVQKVQMESRHQA